MNKTTVSLISVLFALLTALPAFAYDPANNDSYLQTTETVTEDDKQHKKMPLPGKSEVLVVGRIIVKAEEDMDFYAKTRGVKAENFTKQSVISIPMYYDEKEVSKDWAKSQRQIYSDGEFFFVKYDMPRNRNMQFGAIPYYFFSDRKTQIYLPLDFSFDVPKGVNYVYIGTFTYTVTGDDFTIKNVKVTDEYDQAMEAVKTQFPKKDILLSRVDLKDYDAKKTKK